MNTSYDDELPMQHAPQRRTRNTAPKPFAIQPRDIAMLQSLSDARFLSVHELEWLHFPTWRSHYRRHIQDGFEAGAYQPRRSVYERTNRFFTNQLVHQMRRYGSNERSNYHLLPHVYTLTREGAEMLCTFQDTTLDTVWFRDSGKLAVQNFEHSVAIGRCYAAFASETTYRTIPFSHWRSDHLLAKRSTAIGIQFDQIAIPGDSEPFPVLPDATFELAGKRYFLEVDRGTRPITTWTKKIRAYAAYQGHPLLQQRYGVDHAQILVISITPGRNQQIANLVANVASNHIDTYRFTLAMYVHPMSIRRAWQRIVAVEWHITNVAKHISRLPEVTLADEPLWTTDE